MAMPTEKQAVDEHFRDLKLRAYDLQDQMREMEKFDLKNNGQYLTPNSEAQLEYRMLFMELTAVTTLLQRGKMS